MPARRSNLSTARFSSLWVGVGKRRPLDLFLSNPRRDVFGTSLETPSKKLIYTFPEKLGAPPLKESEGGGCEALSSFTEFLKILHFSQNV